MALVLLCTVYGSVDTRDILFMCCQRRQHVPFSVQGGNKQKPSAQFWSAPTYIVFILLTDITTLEDSSIRYDEINKQSDE